MTHKITAQQFSDAHEVGVDAAKGFRCVDGANDKCVRHMMMIVMSAMMKKMDVEYDEDRPVTP